VKQNAGAVTMTGSQAFGAGTTITGGTFTVSNRLETPSIDLADGTTLTVAAGGLVEAAGGTQAAITGSSGTNTLLIDGTLRVAGDLGDGSDIVTLAGTLDTGAGILDLGAGNDVLTFNDGAAITGAGVDAGAGAADELVLNIAGALAFAGESTAGFEQLTKLNAGTVTMTGGQTFSAGTDIASGGLVAAGVLTTPTITIADGASLGVDGTVQGVGGVQTAITGSAGANTVNVGASGLLLATGDLGAGDDVLDVAGTLDIGGGVFSLGDGDDAFVVHDGTNVLGTVDGGAGFDTRVYDISLSADLGTLLGFEGLTKRGTGTLTLNGPGSSSLDAVEVEGGTLSIAAGGGIDGAAATSVAAGSTLNVDGTYAGT